MAVVGNGVLTIADIVKRTKNSHESAVVELLSQFTQITEDAPAVECNNGSAHDTRWRSALSPYSWGRFNRGTAVSKSGQTMVTDICGQITRESQVDIRILDAAGDKRAQVKLEEQMGEFESMAQQAESALVSASLYTDPDQIHGFYPRYNTISGNPFARQIIDCAGTGSDNTSMLAVVWGPMAAHLIFPKGSQAGIKHTAIKTPVRVLDADNNPYWAECDSYRWDIGLTIRDPRAVVRAANIDVSNLTADGSSSSARLMRILKTIDHRATAKNGPKGKKCIYVNANTYEFLDHQAGEAHTGLALTWEKAGPDSPRVVHYRDWLIRRTDAISNAESRVV